MIVPVDETNLLQAATIHSISWKESHRAFCTPDFIETHTPDRQREYLRNKMNNGTKLYMLIEEKPIGVVSVTKGLIEDLYILPDMQNMGYGTKLLLYAVGQCTDTPTLWILENNINAERLYRRIGFKATGRKIAITYNLDEIEFALTLIPVCIKGIVKMDIRYKRLTEKELNTFIHMRINQLREEGAKEEIDLVPALNEYYTRHMTDGTFVSWLALDEGNIIGTSGMSFVEKPPYFGCPSGKIGLLSSMYTDPEYRRRGIAKELLSRVIDDAREYGCGTIQITASDMGVKLYTDFGFVHNGNFMQYKL